MDNIYNNTVIFLYSKFLYIQGVKLNTGITKVSIGHIYVNTAIRIFELHGF